MSTNRRGLIVAWVFALGILVACALCLWGGYEWGYDSAPRVIVQQPPPVIILDRGGR